MPRWLTIVLISLPSVAWADIPPQPPGCGCASLSAAVPVGLIVLTWLLTPRR